MVFVVVVLACLVPATVAGLVSLIPTLAGLLSRRGRQHAPTHIFAILIPAHNEQSTLPAALQSLAVLDYPPELVRVCVVADNCLDATAAVARASGAECVVQKDPTKRGKGYAIALGLERILKDAPDAVLILDADCKLNSDALRALDATFAAGADVAQTAVQSRNADDGPAGFVAAVGAAFDDATAAGWDRLGFSVPLRGTGTAIRRAVFERVPWTAFGLVEDAEYGRRLKAARVRVVYCDGAEVTCEAPPSVAGLCRQRRRWRSAGPFASKPLVLAHLALTVAASAACGFVVWPAALVGVFAGLYLHALFAVGFTRKRLGLLLGSPAVVVRLVGVALAGLMCRSSEWDGSPRTVTRVGRAA